MISLDHIESHGMAVFDDPHKDGTQGFELIDMITVGL